MKKTSSNSNTKIVETNEWRVHCRSMTLPIAHCPISIIHSYIVSVLYARDIIKVNDKNIIFIRWQMTLWTTDWLVGMGEIYWPEKLLIKIIMEKLRALNFGECIK